MARSILEKYEKSLDESFSKPKELSLNYETLDSFSSNLLKKAEKNNYVLCSKYGHSPRLILFGFTHSDRPKIDQENQLVDILSSCLSENDVLLLEGDGGYEIDYSSDQNSLVQKLKDVLISKKIKSFCNEKPLFLGKALVASSQLAYFKEQKNGQVDKNDPEYRRLVKNFYDTLKIRDDNFCYDNQRGIVSLYNTLSEGSKIYQLLGTMHIHLGFIRRNLRKEKIPYYFLVPK